jgi:hypothetical protein
VLGTLYASAIIFIGAFLFTAVNLLEPNRRLAIVRNRGRRRRRNRQSLIARRAARGYRSRSMKPCAALPVCLVG